MAWWLSIAILVGLSFQAESADAPIGGKVFVDRHKPPTYHILDETEAAQVKFGQSVFDTEWVATNAPSISGRVGVGPLFNAASCNACHHEGEWGRGPSGDGLVPIALVVHLESSLADVGAESRGDPVYGHVFNTSALDGVQVEGAVEVRYSEVTGYYYPFGGRWSMRVPHYHLVGLTRGSLAPTTVIKPRLAPALFGVGLLAAVPETAISGQALTPSHDENAGTLAWHARQGRQLLGRFGWQGDAVSILDQTTSAFAREMGLTSNDRSSDDCTPAEVDCQRWLDSNSPEVSAELLDAVVAFMRTLAVPTSPVRVENDTLGPELFTGLGCAECHRPRLPVDLSASGTSTPGFIAPYTDMRLHDLGTQMSDENAAGTKVNSRWRTTPLWGLGYRLKLDSHPTFLHDGRARSVEEAILWHAGEGARAKGKFIELGPRSRAALLRWLETL